MPPLSPLAQLLLSTPPAPSPPYIDQIIGCVGTRMRSHHAHNLLLGIMITQLDRAPAVRALAAEALLGEPEGAWVASGLCRRSAELLHLLQLGFWHAVACSSALLLPSNNTNACNTLPTAYVTLCSLCGQPQGHTAGYAVCLLQAGRLPGEAALGSRLQNVACNGQAGRPPDAWNASATGCSLSLRLC